MPLKNMPNNSSKNILVSGGAGFLGSHLCKKLLDAGNQIFCLDNLETGSLANIDSLSLNKKFHFINADIIDPIKIEVDLDEIYNTFYTIYQC